MGADDTMAEAFCKDVHRLHGPLMHAGRTSSHGNESYCGAGSISHMTDESFTACMRFHFGSCKQHQDEQPYPATRLVQRQTMLMFCIFQAAWSVAQYCHATIIPAHAQGVGSFDGNFEFPACRRHAFLMGLQADGAILVARKSSTDDYCLGDVMQAQQE